MKRPQPEIVRLAVFLGLLVSALAILIAFRQIFLPLFLGLGIAYLLNPPVCWLERHRWSRLVAAVVIATVTLLALAVILVFLVPAIVDQVRALAEHFPGYVEEVQKRFGPWIAGLEARYPEEARELEQRLVDAVKDNLPSIATLVTEKIASAFQGVIDLLLFLLNLVFVPVFAFYLLVDLPRLKSNLADLVPIPYRENVFARVGEMDEAVSSFLRGQLTIALILAALNAVGLVLIGVPWGLLIGVVAGLANVIPYGSTIFGMLPALIVSWIEDQSLVHLIAILALFAAGQALESTVLTPRIIGKKVNLHPVWVLLAIIAGGSLFGFFGMLVAVPTAAAIKVFASHWVRAYKRSSIYHEAGGEGGGTGSSTVDVGD